MKYYIDYQFLPKDAARPIDNGEVVGIEASDASGMVVLPNVGDYVQVDNSAGTGQRSSFSGKVRSRLYRYIRVSRTEVHCAGNMVVEKDDDNWGRLIKE